MSFGEATNLLLAMTDDEDKISSKSGVVSMKIEQMEGRTVAFITKRMFAPDAKVHSIKKIMGKKQRKIQKRNRIIRNGEDQSKIDDASDEAA